jgi:hypothetical protein
MIDPFYSIPAYFYYVSVGGQPHYVTSNNFQRSDYPTSLKAQSVGAMPLAPVHDAQVPHPGGNFVQSRSTPPVYLDFDQQKQQGKTDSSSSSQQQQQTGILFGFIPGNFLQFQQQQGQASAAVNSPVPNSNKDSQQQGQVPFVGYPLFYLKSN